MSGFSADWLALREPFDIAARAESAAAFDLRGMADRMRGGAKALSVVDLGCGTGANLRALAPRLGGSQRWLLVDHDPKLLAALPRVIGGWARAQGLVLRAGDAQLHVEGAGWDAEIRWLQADLVGALDTVSLVAAQLVTAAALLDLVSAPWLRDLFERVRRANAAVFFALDVDGRLDWYPALEHDAEVHALFAAHQRRDKGFGPALGGESSSTAAALLEAMGYGVAQARSDWHIDSGPMLASMIQGIASAALEQMPGAAPVVDAWRAQRSASPQSRLCVGHLDLLAVP
ncbi:class I SAM-dependent methyltransferase [Variovorax sp. KK3]|uniref:class I SAM-dependent methyltransferase n=1 Tax=Variovorax sp. KK3 TaxID=1855728 RepID=UPI00097BB89B|nr:class I SAM-dependent methyltransferase [Variovorax sp. KK3]